MNIVLASASPRRRELMSIITQKFQAVSVDADESIIHGEAPQELVMRLSTLKAAAVSDSGSAVIGCDTVVDLNGKILGKPKNESEALGMLEALSGNEHYVHTGVCIICGKKREIFCVSTRVTFGEIAQKALIEYVKTSEPYDKAGGYGIQSWAARYINKIDGCFFNVMGFPVAAIYAKLQEMKVLDN